MIQEAALAGLETADYRDTEFVATSQCAAALNQWSQGRKLIAFGDL
jgi:hypothetical protein